MKKITKGNIYTWESCNIPVCVLKKSKAIDMVYVLTEDEEIHHIDKGNLIELTEEHQNLDWSRLLSNDFDF